MLGIENSSFFNYFILFLYFYIFIFLYPDFSEKPFHPTPSHQKKKKKSIHFIMLHGSFFYIKVG